MLAGLCFAWFLIVGCSINSREHYQPIYQNNAASEDARAFPILRTRDRIVFLGDSITIQNCYTRPLENYLRAFYPELELQFSNAGISGDTAQGGLVRLKEDVLKTSPTVVTICFGMNDVFTTSIDQYRSSLREIVQQLKAADIRPILLTPPCLIERHDPGRFTGKNAELEQFAYSVIVLAGEEQVPVVDLFHFMLRQETLLHEHSPGQTLIPDGVHPNEAGGMAMAIQILHDLKLFPCDGHPDLE
jgi:lysophospholipase L1-like esterase